MKSIIKLCFVVLAALCAMQVAARAGQTGLRTVGVKVLLWRDVILVWS